MPSRPLSTSRAKGEVGRCLNVCVGGQIKIDVAYAPQLRQQARQAGERVLAMTGTNEAVEGYGVMCLAPRITPGGGCFESGESGDDDAGLWMIGRYRVASNSSGFLETCQLPRPAAYCI